MCLGNEGHRECVQLARPPHDLPTQPKAMERARHRMDDHQVDHLRGAEETSNA